MSSSKKYICLSVADKKKLIEAIQCGVKKGEVAKNFGVPPSTVSTIWKNRDSILASSSTGGRKRSSKGEFPRLEECLLKWFCQCRSQNIPIGGLC